MGFLLEKYNDNSAGLVVSFYQTEDSDNFFSGDSIEGAITYFNLRKRDNRLYVVDKSEQTMENIGIYPEEATALRAILNEKATTFTDEEALNNMIYFARWQEGVAYKVDDRIRYNEKLYKCVQAHTSQADWMPTATPALWVAISLEEYPEWVQPTGAHDAYAKGAKVSYEGKKYISTIDANVWAPGVSGWDEVVEE